jgi:hypothetical protein
LRGVVYSTHHAADYEAAIRDLEAVVAAAYARREGLVE